MRNVLPTRIVFASIDASVGRPNSVGYLPDSPKEAATPRWAVDEQGRLAEKLHSCFGMVASSSKAQAAPPTTMSIQAHAAAFNIILRAWSSSLAGAGAGFRGKGMMLLGRSMAHRSAAPTLIADRLGRQSKSIETERRRDRHRCTMPGSTRR
ncbi:MAG: hypothetical protein HZA66_18910 [Rhodopseudomonas palustris]|uniref:Uncharacterized protein n=1 Tax=Rhodopseudomonas palustris TaxID=1076 RepID=A0A933W3S4_RHOPL|nr:hypothetical protein [Rhodopseudomonas palustris]